MDHGRPTAQNKALITSQHEIGVESSSTAESDQLIRGVMPPVTYDIFVC